MSDRPGDLELRLLSVFLAGAAVAVVLATGASGAGLLVGTLLALAAVIITPSPG